MQNEAGKVKWPITPALIEELLEVFRVGYLKGGLVFFFLSFFFFFLSFFFLFLLRLSSDSPHQIKAQTDELVGESAGIKRRSVFDRMEGGSKRRK